MVGSANLKDIASRNFSKKYWNDKTTLTDSGEGFGI